MGGCNRAVAGPPSSEEEPGIAPVSLPSDAPGLPSPGGSALERGDEASGAVGKGELVVGSVRGVEKGEGDKSDGRAAPASEGIALVAIGALVDGNPLFVEMLEGKGVGSGDPESPGEPPASEGKLGTLPKPGGSARVAGWDSFCCWLYATSDAGDRNGFDGSVARVEDPTCSEPGMESFPLTTGGGGGHESGVSLKSCLIPSTVWFAYEGCPSIGSES